ncbi:family 43 glycosylhydrolase [Sphingomonas sp. LM7]|uniref:family 43 glycosylhydrolase n=1 Tax=Sphingomonas sp. LM7 TaxID=1938607 RepID=UPI0009865A0D|nr:family 43 glycosylhydrolase [Sphingomonas sp. LM7]
MSISVKRSLAWTGASAAALLLALPFATASQRAGGVGQEAKLIAKYSDTSRIGRPYAKDPSVIRFGNRYLMYYSIPPAQDNRKGGDGFPTGWAIGIAESRDLKSWKKAGEVLPVQQVERNGIAAPGAVVIRGKVHLFYQTYGNGRNDAINHAVSSDGIHFDRDPGNPVFHPDPAQAPWSAGRAIDAEVFVHGDKLLLYYATRDPEMKVQKIGVAQAPLNSAFGKGDFKNLNNDAAILTPELPWERNCIEAASIIRRGDKLYMFYAGGYNNEPQQIGVAVSTDGVKWTRLSDRPFLTNGPPGSWNSSESGHPGIFQDGKRTYLFFQGNPDRGKTWTLAATEIGWNKQGPYLK